MNDTKRKKTTARGKRMAPKDREAMIVKEAVLYFAEHGLEGSTRKLARQIGITQPLLYRYFPSKESLIERVYQEVYVQRWNSKWDSLIPDRSQPLKQRLYRFYKEYAAAVYDYVWVRIFVFSGLKGVDINDRYLAIIREKVLEPVCTELRVIGNLPTPEKEPLSEAEIEWVWGLHGMFFYRAIRHFVYGLPLDTDIDAAIENDIDTFLAGAKATQKKILKKAKG
ncbi:MAG: TetR/AcrR family transcriptional regulator [Rhodospirillaceae bacterium]|nr:TetR/AcrR family transcriptional regulator [Rhodospirillaceae bacterium]